MNWNKLILPSGILLLNIIVKLLFINDSPIGGDESFTLFYAQTDYATLLEMFETENNPPLYTLIMKYWIQLFGLDAFSVRFLPMLFSSFAAVGVYKLGRAYGSKFVGIFASLLFTFTSYHMYFAHECRPYALFALLTVLGMLLFKQVTIDQRRRRLYLLALVNVLLIYTHFFGFFVLFVQFLSFILIRPIRLKSWNPLVTSWALTILAYLPYTPLIVKRFGVSSSGTWLESPTISGLYDNLWKFSNEPVNTVLFLIVLLSGLVIWRLRKKGKTKPSSYILVIWFLVPYLLMFAISFNMPMFLDRYLVFISLAYYLLIAVSVESLFRASNWKWVIAGGLVIMMIFTCDFKAGNTRGDDQFVAESVAGKTSNIAVILCPDWYYMTFAYHFNREIFEDHKNTKTRLEENNIFPRAYLNDENSAEILSKDNIVFVNTGALFVDPENKIIALIMKDYELWYENKKFSPFVISYYRKTTTN